LFDGSRSRFGRLLEGAYDEMVFQDGQVPPFPRSTRLPKALSHVQIRTSKGLKLQEQGSGTLQASWRDPRNSSFFQGIDAAMRDAGIEALENHSARRVEDVIRELNGQLPLPMH
jgi:hypothetical protein